MASAIDLEQERSGVGDRASVDATSAVVTLDPRWTAITQRDASWDGVFVFAVTSTRIYCRPSCPSRRPRADRVRFFVDGGAARAAGFRSCKRCMPDASTHGSERKQLIARAIVAIHQDEDASLDALASTVGVSRGHLQKTFSEVIGASPLEYVTARKAARMREQLIRGSSVTTAAFAAGFESLPRAYAASDQHLGMPPGQFRRGAAGAIVRYRVVPCALGQALIALTDRGVCRIILGDDAAALEAELRVEFPNASIGEADEVMSMSIDAVVTAAAGKAVLHAVPVDLRGTAFQQRVWRALMRIPRGERMSYTALAREVDSPRAVRAVGSACGANPVALLVPCHRVVRSDGALGGYRWGLERKKRLLESEG